ncbi:hypothetical protein ABB37_00764 [Leptomonas pyrrhocoris]|uniref:Uncharacterized protein n=1 Tax=Leptomonas pyrrhocoris TaxID=157538 RepID=A0A0N0E0N7_LEPPY|nr:hypothetical protein ABB37_00764 [Leptomonas pyrrhocoris]KPA86662.1 hypothetical protein ABB37_00764 [Leptomonas pyrrhocoris]|eukprot:XP_015665101.1 hypothetical protein ABB37_00764 [Leptomonas pyrrhocoris]
MSSSTQDELRRTQQYLVEVIDECVFVERQRELMERRLASQISNQKNALNDTFTALEYLCRYTCQIECVVLPSLLAWLPTTSSSRQDLLHARTDVEARLEQLTAKNSERRADGNSLLLPPLADSLEKGVSTEDVAPPPPPPSPLLPTASAEVMHRLLQHKVVLFDALTKAASKLDSMQLNASSENAELQGLRARMDELTRLVAVGATTSALGPPAVALAVSHDSSKGEETKPSAVRFAQARVIAYEKTVQTLNNELALLHENYAALSRASATEMNRLKQHNCEAQRRHDDQVAECDAVLGRLSLELEQLIHENAQLKQKLRTVVHIGS